MERYFFSEEEINGVKSKVDKTVEIEITKAELEEKFFKGVLSHSKSKTACI